MLLATGQSMSKHTISGTTNIVDGAAMKILPGDTIEIPNNYATPLRFLNIKGTADKPITIYGGSIRVDIKLSYCVKFEGASYFDFLDTQMDGGHIGLSIEKRSTNFNLAGLGIRHVGFAGVMAKDDGAKRGEFTLRDSTIHHCVVEYTGGEGMYIGPSDYAKGLSHDLKGIHIFKNIVKHTAWEGIQLGGCVEGAIIEDNTVIDYGTAKKAQQNNGIQIGEGTGGLCFRNTINQGSGNGIICLGLGDNIIFENLISHAGEHGVFCDDRLTTGPGFQFLRNTIVKAKTDGIRLYARKQPTTVRENLIVAPGGEFIKLRAGVVVKDNDQGTNILVR